MKSKSLVPFVMFFLTLADPLSTAFAQGTAFTYQGRLNDGAGSANGTYDLIFTLFDANTGGFPVAGPVTNSAVAISNGLFTTTINFGSGVFNGASNWLEIAVSTNNAGTFTTLAPRQLLAPTPYAIFAGSANGVNGLTITQNSSGAPNIIGGASLNYISSNVIAGTIAGGGATNVAGPRGVVFQYSNVVTGDYGTVGGGIQNTAGSISTTVGGGTHNTAGGQNSTVSGGADNTASGNYSVVAGGFGNLASSLDSVVSGGANNIASNQFSVVSGGQINTAGGQYATVSGGTHNIAATNYATVPGGNHNTASGIASFAAGANAQALHDGSFVWADNMPGNFASTVSNQFSVRAQGGIKLAGDVEIDNSAYHHLSLTGGNSLGFLYGSYASLGDGIHLGYNFYADALGTNHVINSGGGTSRISMGYGSIALLTGYVNGWPYNGLTINGPGVPVNISSSGMSIGLAYNTSAQPAQSTLDIWYQILFRNGTGIWGAGITSANNFGFWYGYPFNSATAYIDSSGNYHQVSDRKLKHDIANIDHGLDRLLQLRPVSYHFYTNSTLCLGLIAQEVEPYFPELVGSDTNGTKDLVYSGLIPVTIRSIQELNQKLETEKKQKDIEIQNLRRQNQSLEARLTRLETTLKSLSQNK